MLDGNEIFCIVDRHAELPFPPNKFRWAQRHINELNTHSIWIHSQNQNNNYLFVGDARKPFMRILFMSSFAQWLYGSLERYLNPITWCTKTKRGSDSYIYYTHVIFISKIIQMQERVEKKYKHSNSSHVSNLECLFHIQYGACCSFTRATIESSNFGMYMSTVNGNARQSNWSSK